VDKQHGYFEVCKNEKKPNHWVQFLLTEKDLKKEAMTIQ
jgi:hypothetical protein